MSACFALVNGAVLGAAGWQSALVNGATVAAVSSLLGLALVHGTAVAAVAWLLELALRRWVSPAFLSALWTIALVKFFVPWGPAFRFSLSSAIEEGQRGLAFAPLEVLGSGQPGPGGAPWATAALAGWALVVAVLLVRRRVVARRLAELLARLPEAPLPLLLSVERAAKVLKLRTTPRVRVGAGPFVAGWWRPTLVLPAVLPDGEAGRAVLLHELSHLRRADQWVRLLQTLAQVLFFFWPPVALVNRRIEHHRELACDQAALGASSLSAVAYARVLLDAHRGAVVAPLQFAVLEMASQSSRLERRIDMVLKLKRGRSMKWGVLALVSWVLLALSGSALASDAGGMLGSLDKELIQGVVHANRAQIRDCYDASLQSAPQLAGKLVFGWTISRAGATQNVHLLTSGFSSKQAPAVEGQLASCIAAAVGSWTFPVPRGNGEVEVTYPFMFTGGKP
jgi:beta-lactamase regulating signal transducer with metallopeptidase domain